MGRTLWIGFVLLVGCGNSAELPPTSTPTPQPIVFATSEPTSTPTPTATATAAATETPVPTATATAIPTAVAEVVEDTNSAETEAPLTAMSDIDTAVEALLAQMTLDEKIGQMTLVEKDSITPDGVTQFHIGAVLSGGGGSPTGNNTPAGWHEMVSGFQEAALDTRLGIPLLYGVDAVHGHSNVWGATIFPHNVGLGATRNAELVEEIGRITAIETLATGIHWNYSPVLAVPRDIRWGRAYEGYSENTDVVDLLGVALMRGMQGATLDDDQTVLATPKHWIADGGAAWGTSSTENFLIDQGDAPFDEETLRRVHMPPYITAIAEGAQSVMISYSSWQGGKLHGQAYLINDVLKGEFGFNGFVVSDWKAIDQLEGDYYSDVVTAINAGIDMNMVPYDYRGFINALTTAVESGDVSESRIDDAVRRILRVKMALGLFDQPQVDTSNLDLLGADAHRAVARQAVQESLVLLTNRDDALPLNKDADRIFVAGQHADNMGFQSGGWTIEWQGFSGALPIGSTILDGISATVSANTDVVFDRFGTFEGIEGDADIGIVVIGEQPYAEGFGDRADLTLNGALVERMRERADIVIAVVISGRPMVITDWVDSADSVVAAWLPGSEGAGVSDVLFGDHEFVGTLPFSWPRSTAQLPYDFDNMPTAGCDAPLFPFGHGLTFEDNGTVEIADCP